MRILRYAGSGFLARPFVARGKAPLCNTVSIARRPRSCASNARSIRLKCFLGGKLLPMRAGWPFNGRRAPRRGRQAIRGRLAGIRSGAWVGGRGRMSPGEKRGKTRAQMTLNGAAEFFPGAAGGSGPGKARGKRGETGHGRAQRKNSAVRRARPMRCGLRAEGRATATPRRFRRLA